VRLIEVRIQNFKSIDDSGVIGLNPINLLMGPNDSGKSAFLQAVYTLQVAGGPRRNSVRVGAKEALIEGRFVETAYRPQLPIAQYGTEEVHLLAKLAEEGGLTFLAKVAKSGTQGVLEERNSEARRAQAAVATTSA
jgi:AAA15 family ATPase/GTPase